MNKTENELKKEELIRRYTTVTSGMRGYFAALMGVFTDGKREWSESIMTGPTLKSFGATETYAKQWAEAEEITYGDSQ